MRRSYLLSGLALVLVFGLAAPGHSQKPAAKDKKNETLAQRLARESNLKEEDINKVLKALGPAVRDELTRGKTVSLQGLGTFRVVRVAGHRDLREGRPVNVPPSNYVEFLPTGEVLNSANSDTAVPAETVPAFEYEPLPNQTKGQKVGPTRAPAVRVR